MSASTHQTNMWESSRLLQVEYESILRLNNKAVTKTKKDNTQKGVMPFHNFSMLDQSSIVMHIVQRNRFMMLTIFKIWDKKKIEKKCTVVHPRFTSVLFLWESYKCHTSSRSVEKTDDYSALCVSMFTFNVEGKVLFIMWHMIVLFWWSGFLSHMWHSGHLFFIIVVHYFSFIVAFTSQFSQTCRPV